jgi:uncharacterized protein YxeA
MTQKRIIITVVAALVLVTIGLTFFYKPSTNSSTQTEAIRQAEAYQPDGVCGMAMTPATHTATGAKYTFSSTCLAPGWVRDDHSDLNSQ